MQDNHHPQGSKQYDNFSTDVERFLSILHPDGQFEIRSPKCPDRAGVKYVSTASGYFHDRAAAAREVLRLEALKPPAVYVTVNPVVDALLARAVNRIDRSKPTSSKGDVFRRRWLFIDIDSRRPSGVSATDAELAEADKVSDAIVEGLARDGWPEPLQGMSGNGRYLFYRIDLPNDQESETLIKSVLKGLGDRFNTAGAEVDQTPFDANRICKVLGTWARKGDTLVGVAGVDDRPHRQSWFIDPGGPLELTDVALLRAVAASDTQKAVTRPKPNLKASASEWDVDKWLRDHHVPVADPMPYEGGRKWLFTELPKCCESHGHGFDGSSCIIERADGMMGAMCQHDHCSWTWRDLRQAYEPGCYDRADTYGVELSGILKQGQVDQPSDPEPEAKAKEPRVRPKLICLADVEPRPVRWLWQDRLPAGRVSMIVGMPGLGKSFLTCDMAARVTTGRMWPDGSPCERGSVILISCEDDPGDTIRPRLDAHGADVNQVHLLSGSLVRDADGKESELMFSLSDVSVLESALSAVEDCRLIVIDPIGSFLGGRTDAHRDNEVRAVLAPVAMLAERTGAAVLMVAHRRKSSGGTADDSALGSRAFTGLARAVWHLSADPDDDERRLWLPGKNNLAKRTSGLAFRIVGPGAEGRVDWEPDAVGMSADDAMARERTGDNGERSAVDEAEAWLIDNLDQTGRPAKELKRYARGDGIKDRTLDRAADRLGILRGPDGFGGPWMWRMPCIVSPSDPSFLQSRQGGNSGETDETVARLDEPGETPERERGYL